MKSPQTIKKNRDFRKVYAAKNSKATSRLVLYRRKRTEPETRVGISVSKKVGNSVVRHRLKRRLHEILRLNTDLLPEGQDLVVVVRVSAAKASYQELEQDLFYLLRKIRKGSVRAEGNEGKQL